MKRAYYRGELYNWLFHHYFQSNLKIEIGIFCMHWFVAGQNPCYHERIYTIIWNYLLSGLTGLNSTLGDIRPIGNRNRHLD